MTLSFCSDETLMVLAYVFLEMLHGIPGIVFPSCTGFGWDRVNCLHSS